MHWLQTHPWQVNHACTLLLCVQSLASFPFATCLIFVTHCQKASLVHGSWYDVESVPVSHSNHETHPKHQLRRCNAQQCFFLAFDRLIGLFCSADFAANLMISRLQKAVFQLCWTAWDGVRMVLMPFLASRTDRIPEPVVMENLRKQRKCTDAHPTYFEQLPDTNPFTALLPCRDVMHV